MITSMHAVLDRDVTPPPPVDTFTLRLVAFGGAGQPITMYVTGTAGDEITIAQSGEAPYIETIVSTGVEQAINYNTNGDASATMFASTPGTITRTRLDSATNWIQTFDLQKGLDITSLNSCLLNNTEIRAFQVNQTLNLTNMESVCQNAPKLASVILPIDLPNLTSIASGFTDCILLVTINVFDTSNASNVSLAWRGCAGIITFPLFDFSSAAALNSTWQSCTSMISHAGATTTSLLKDVNGTFRLCSLLESIGSINTSAVTQFSNYYGDCSSLICVTDVDTTNQSFTSGMFDNTPALVAPNGTEQTAILSGDNYVNAGACP